MKKQRGVFLVEAAILFGIFLSAVTALHKTEAERAQDLQDKSNAQVQAETK